MIKSLLVLLYLSAVCALFEVPQYPYDPNNQAMPEGFGAPEPVRKEKTITKTIGEPGFQRTVTKHVVEETISQK